VHRQLWESFLPTHTFCPTLCRQYPRQAIQCSPLDTEVPKANFGLVARLRSCLDREESPAYRPKALDNLRRLPHQRCRSREISTMRRLTAARRCRGLDKGHSVPTCRARRHASLGGHRCHSSDSHGILFSNRSHCHNRNNPRPMERFRLHPSRARHRWQWRDRHRFRARSWHFQGCTTSPLSLAVSLAFLSQLWKRIPHRPTRIQSR
jgi:hypothetical protein